MNQEKFRKDVRNSKDLSVGYGGLSQPLNLSIKGIHSRW